MKASFEPKRMLQETVNAMEALGAAFFPLPNPTNTNGLYLF